MMVQGRKLTRSAESCCDDLEELLSVDFFRALSDPNRIVLLRELSHGAQPSTVSEAAGCCQVDMSVVSRHLATLRDAGVLDAEKRGRQVYYSVPHQSIAATLRTIADAIEACASNEPELDTKELSDA